MSLNRLTKTPEEMRKVTERFGVSSADELYVATGYGKVSPRAVADFLAPPKEGDKAAEPPASIREGRIESLVRKVTGKDTQGIRLNGIDDVLVRYTKCCNPLPGDEIIGFITRGRGITVHRRNCPKAFDTDPERRVEISWDARAKINRPVQIKVMTANRPGILATVGHTFHEQGINISEATCRASDDGRAMNTFTFLCSDLAQLKNVIRQLQRIPGVMAVERT
jgi:GTP pyrophosphokinase